MAQRARFQSSSLPFNAPRPDWLRVKAPMGEGYEETRRLVLDKKLHTVCEEAACPNIGSCWQRKHASVMILGDICTRSCRFCHVKMGKPTPVNPDEPLQVAHLVRDMGLKHIVITSVDRDDLPDGGATHFAQCIMHIRALSPATSVEVLTPDFLNKKGALEIVLDAKPDVLNHNLETVPRLYRDIRPKARYFYSLNMLWRAKQYAPSIFTKSGIMVGIGEYNDEVAQVMDDMRMAGIDFMTIGQYLQPTPFHAPIDRYVHPDDFEHFKKLGEKKGFLLVSSSPLTRSSHFADADFQELRQRVAQSAP